MKSNKGQTKMKQAPNDEAKSLQPKKSWVEPELAFLNVENGGIQNSPESIGGTTS